MPDFTIETYPMCAKLERWEGEVNGHQVEYFRGEWHCSCHGFKFRQNCKHIREAAGNLCNWHGAYDEPQEEEGVCPRCGEPSTYVRVAT